MIGLLKIEWIKIKQYRTFWVFIGIFILSTLTVYWAFDRFAQSGPTDLSQVYRFPQAWYFSSYVGSWFTLFLALLTINLVSNEISFRTLRQHITDGMTASEVIRSKVLLIAAISLGAMVFTMLTCLTIALIKGTISSAMLDTKMLIYPARLFWNCFGLCSAGMMIALLMKRSALSILVFLGWYWLLEPILGRAWLKDVYAFFPLNSLDEFVPSPFSIDPPGFGLRYTGTTELILGLIFPIVFIIISYRLLRSRDL